MKDIEKIKSVLIELLRDDYLLRDTSKNWYKLKEHKEEINNYFKENLSYELVITSNMAKLQKYIVIGDKTKGIEAF